MAVPPQNRRRLLDLGLPIGPSRPGHGWAGGAGGPPGGKGTTWARTPIPTGTLGGLTAPDPRLSTDHCHSDRTVPVGAVGEQGTGICASRALRSPLPAARRWVKAGRRAAEPLWRSARSLPAPFPRDAAAPRAPTPAPPALASPAPPARNSRKSWSRPRRRSRGGTRASRDLGLHLRTREAAAPGTGAGTEGGAWPGPGTAQSRAGRGRGLALPGGGGAGRRSEPGDGGWGDGGASRWEGARGPRNAPRKGWRALLGITGLGAETWRRPLLTGGGAQGAERSSSGRGLPRPGVLTGRGAGKCAGPSVGSADAAPAGPGSAEAKSRRWVGSGARGGGPEVLREGPQGKVGN